MIETCQIAVKNSQEGPKLRALHFLNSWNSGKVPLYGGAVFTILLILSNPTLSRPFQANVGDKEFANITRLHNEGWEEKHEGNSEASVKLFREAAGKLKAYRSKHLRDRLSLSFLRLTYELAYLSELGNRDKDAREFYEKCLAHSLIDSVGATVDKVPISQLAKKRLTVIEERSRQRSKPISEDYPRVSIRGGSKGEKDLPTRISDFGP